MCRECTSRNSKKCSKHGVNAKSLCFSLECNALVCEDCYEEQNYNNNISDVVYCEECIAKYNDGKDINVTFYQNSLKYYEKRTTPASSTGSISGSGSACVNVHLVNRKFPCSECSYVAKFKSTLEEHTKSVHRKLKDLVCQECSKAFSRRSSLADHVKRVHFKIKTKLCNICNAAFYGNSEVEQHMKCKHGL